jgi:hypothetical protein
MHKARQKVTAVAERHKDRWNKFFSRGDNLECARLLADQTKKSAQDIQRHTTRVMEEDYAEIWNIRKPLVWQVIGHVSETLTSPVSETLTSPVFETLTSPVSETLTSPVSETLISPVCETLTSPVSETLISPVSETLTSPVCETLISPVSEFNPNFPCI